MRGAVCAALVATVVARAWLGASLDLMGDEAFYWMCSRHPDVAYSDHPPVTALMVRLGTALGGHTPFGVRWPFALCGALLPALIWLLTRRLCGVRAAWGAAGLCLTMPLLQMTPTLATPDAPLLLFAAATLLFADRALEGRRTGDWLAAGACAGLGMATHYRFVLVPLSIGAWLLASRAGRAHLRSGGAWGAAALTAAGGLPALAFNLREDFAPLTYQFVVRHGVAIGPRGFLNQAVEQALVVTPFLLVALLAALVEAGRRGRRGDERAGLLACAAATPMVVFFATSAMSDQSHDHVHWPQVGYLPLLVYAPGVLERWAARGRAGRLAAALAPALAGALLVASVFDLSTGRVGFLPQRPFRGWTELGRRVEALREQEGGRPPVLVADTYIAAAQLSFQARGEPEVYALDHAINRKHGRALQYELWGLGEAGLATRAGEPVLLILDRSETRSRDAPAWEGHVRSLFADLEDVGEVDAGVRRFTILRGDGFRPPPEEAGSR